MNCWVQESVPGHAGLFVLGRPARFGLEHGDLEEEVERIILLALRKFSDTCRG